MKDPLRQLPGVAVDEVTKGSMTCSGENLDTDAIIAALEELGYGATVQ